MWMVTTLPLLVALVAAALAWQHATRLDRWSANAGQGEPRDEQRSWGLALGALVVALAATTILQLVLWSRLASGG